MLATTLDFSTLTDRPPPFYPNGWSGHRLPCISDSSRRRPPAGRFWHAIRIDRSRCRARPFPRQTSWTGADLPCSRISHTLINSPRSMKHISPRWRLEGQLATCKRLQLECKIPQVAQALFLRSCAFSPGLQTIYPASTSLVIMTLVILLVPPRSCGRMLATLPGRKLDSQAVLPQLSQRHHPDRDAENSFGHHAHPISCLWRGGFLILMGKADSGQSRGTMGSGLPC